MKHLPLMIALGCATAFSCQVQAKEIYKNVDANGRVTYSYKKTTNAKNMRGGYEMKASKYDKNPKYASFKLQSFIRAVDELADWCSDNVPQSRNKIYTAKRDWTKKHQKLIDKAEIILAGKMTAEERRFAYMFENHIYKQIIKAIEKEPKYKQQNMCNGYADRIRTPQFNFMSNPVLVNTISKYKIKKR